MVDETNFYSNSIPFFSYVHKNIRSLLMKNMKEEKFQIQWPQDVFAHTLTF